VDAAGRQRRRERVVDIDESIRHTGCCVSPSCLNGPGDCRASPRRVAGSSPRRGILTPPSPGTCRAAGLVRCRFTAAERFTRCRRSHAVAVPRARSGHKSCVP